jgi:RNA polymerase sigma-70 factor (ECF subfamily)
MRPEAHTNPDELLTDARAGCDASLGRLLECYTNYLKLLATTQIDEKLRARCSPSDIVQETFYEAHRDFRQFRGGSEAEFLAWLRQILAHNLARVVEAHVLTAKRDVRREISLNGLKAAVDRSAARLESVLVDRGTSPSSNVHRREYAVLLADRLAELPPDYREVLVLRHFDDLPFDEVAQRMDRSSGAVRMLWLRAIGRLRELLTERGLL